MSNSKNLIDFQFDVRVKSKNENREQNEPKRTGFNVFFECEGIAPFDTIEEAEAFAAELRAKFQSI